MKQYPQNYWLCVLHGLKPLRNIPYRMAALWGHSVVKRPGFIILLGFMLVNASNLQAQVNCKVTDYLYLNDPGEGTTHKFELLSNKTAGEISNGQGQTPWLSPNTGGVAWSPHGLGQDLNGNIYIGQDPGGPIAQFRADGTLVPGKTSFIKDGGFNFVSKDGYVYVNSTGISPGTANNRIIRYKLCDGSMDGYITLANVSSSPYPTTAFKTGVFTDWGLQITADGTIYANAGINMADGTTRHTYIYKFNVNTVNWNNNITITGQDLGTGPLDSKMSTDIQVWGIATDKSGQIYMVVQDANYNGTGDDYTLILKYDASFNFKGSYAVRNFNNNGNPNDIRGGRGIIYYAPWDMLLVAAGKNGDCIAKIDPHTLSYLGALVPNAFGASGSIPKTLRVASEACPTGSVTVDTTLCNAKVGDRIFLANLVGSCGAPISGTWSASPSTGITYNSCDQSFTIDDLATACGHFQITQSGGSCPGTFAITVNVDVADVTAPVIAGDQTVCTGDTPAPFTVTIAAKTSSAKPIKYQWQKSTTSCTDGFADIPGATSSTYASPVITQTTYFRVITTVDGSCTTPNGSCTATSNCVTLTPKVCCPTGNCYPTTVKKN